MTMTTQHTMLWTTDREGYVYRVMHFGDMAFSKYLEGTEWIEYVGRE